MCSKPSPSRYFSKSKHISLHVVKDGFSKNPVSMPQNTLAFATVDKRVLAEVAPCASRAEFEGKRCSFSKKRFVSPSEFLDPTGAAAASVSKPKSQTTAPTPLPLNSYLEPWIQIEVTVNLGFKVQGFGLGAWGLGLIPHHLPGSFPMCCSIHLKTDTPNL